MDHVPMTEEELAELREYWSRVETIPPSSPAYDERLRDAARQILRLIDNVQRVEARVRHLEKQRKVNKLMQKVDRAVRDERREP